MFYRSGSWLEYLPLPRNFNIFEKHYWREVKWFHLWAFHVFERDWWMLFNVPCQRFIQTRMRYSFSTSCDVEMVSLNVTKNMFKQRWEANMRLHIRFHDSVVLKNRATLSNPYSPQLQFEWFEWGSSNFWLIRLLRSYLKVQIYLRILGGN